MKYIALFETDPKADGVGVVFPDIPDCFSSGENYEEALRNAHEILAFCLEEKQRKGEDLPVARSLEQIKKEWDDWKFWEKECEFIVGYVSYIPLNKPRKYTLYFDSALMAQIDAVTKNRSAFLTEAAKAFLGNK